MREAMVEPVFLAETREHHEACHDEVDILLSLKEEDSSGA